MGKISRAVEPLPSVVQVSPVLEGRADAVGKTKRAARRPPVGRKQTVKPMKFVERGGQALAQSMRWTGSVSWNSRGCTKTIGILTHPWNSEPK